MRKAVSYFVVGCIVSAWLLAPATLNSAEASPAMALITGTVKDDSGKPLSGAIVALFTAQPGQIIGGSLLKNLTTDAEGRFKANIAPGMYKLRAAADGFRPTFTLITLDAANKLTHHFSLRRVGTVVENRGDKGDYRWIGRSVPRSVLHYQEDEDNDSRNAVVENTPKQESHKQESKMHGVVQFTSVKAGDANFTGANFAISSSFGDNLEFALIGQGGLGEAAPQRLAAIASLRPKENHQVTAMAGYAQAMIRERNQLRSLDQFSFAAMDSWQVSKPLLLILGFDYSTFANSIGKGRDSILPRVAVQFTPTARTQINAALTPGTNSWRQTQEGLDTENVQTRFESQPAEVAMAGAAPVADRSRRLEFGFEQVFGEEGDSSVEAAAFFDTISGHGVGLMALPLEASSENQKAFQQVARQVVAMNGAARGMRVMYAKQLNEYLSASVGYSFGRGERLNDASLDQLTPARIFTGSNFQVASAKLDLDLTRRTGTRVSTVVRLSPSAVVFAIDPFAGRMSVYDPNVSIYVTQALPTFGLPVKCQALVDMRNLLNQTIGSESDTTQLIAARSQRSVRGAISFQW